MQRLQSTILSLVLLTYSVCILADPPIEVVQRAKKATALVSVEEADGTAEGSAFCIDTSGLFVTNAHVVEGLKPGGRLILVLHSGDPDQVKLSANVVKLDKGKDLAMLQVAHPKSLISLPLGNTSDLVETMSVIAFGYPFGTDLALKEGDFPNITISTGHITSLRTVDGVLAAVQLDASLNEGNSGGPIINSKGEVIAIVMEGIPGSGINLAIPVSYLSSFLKSLNILFTPPTARANNLHDKQEFRVELLKPLSGNQRANVDITLKSGPNDKRTVRAETEDGRVYTARLPLVGADSTSQPNEIYYDITATRSGKTIASEEGRIEVEGLGVVPAPVHAALPTGCQLYEGFDYPSGKPMTGLGGGIGNFAEPWHDFGAGATESFVTDHGLKFGNLKTSGNAIMTSSRAQIGHARPFQVSPGKVGGVLFISFLVQPQDVIDRAHPGNYFAFDYGGIAVGCGQSSYYWIDQAPYFGDGKINAKVPAVSGETAFIVLRITFGGPNDNDKVELFVNPTPGRPLPATPDATKSDRNTGVPTDFDLRCTIRCVFDELRFGSTFKDVAPTK